MDIKAIIYTSNAGHTAHYAKLLSEQLSVPAYTVAEAKTKLEKGANVIYMGWLMAGIVKGYKKAKRYNVALCVGVGMAPPSDSERARLAKQNHVDIEKFQMLLGGFDIKKLHGVYKFMMTAMVKAMGKGLSNKPDITADEKLMLDMALHGGDYVSVENLAPIIEFVK